MNVDVIAHRRLLLASTFHFSSFAMRSAAPPSPYIRGGAPSGRGAVWPPVYAARVGAGEGVPATVDRLHPLGFVAHGDARHAEPERFLLHPARSVSILRALRSSASISRYDTGSTAAMPGPGSMPAASMALRVRG